MSLIDLLPEPVRSIGKTIRQYVRDATCGGFQSPYLLFGDPRKPEHRRRAMEELYRKD